MTIIDVTEATAYHYATLTCVCEACGGTGMRLVVGDGSAWAFDTPPTTPTAYVMCQRCHGTGQQRDPVVDLFVRRWIEDGPARFAALLNEETTDGRQDEDPVDRSDVEPDPRMLAREQGL